MKYPGREDPRGHPCGPREPPTLSQAVQAAGRRCDFPRWPPRTGDSGTGLRSTCPRRKAGGNVGHGTGAPPRAVRMWWGAPRKACEILGRETNRCEAPVPGLIVPGAEGQATGSAGQVPGPQGQAPATGHGAGTRKGATGHCLRQTLPHIFEELEAQEGEGTCSTCTELAGYPALGIWLW